MSIFSKPNFEKLKFKNDIKGLVKLLNSKDIDLLKDAIKVLLDLKNDNALFAVINCLFSENKEIRAYAADSLALIQFKPGNTFEEISLLVANKKWDPLYKTATDSLLTSINYTDKFFEENANYKLQANLVFVFEYRLIIYQILYERGASITDYLIENLNYVNDRSYTDSIYILGLIGDSKAIIPLINILKEQKESPLSSVLAISLQFLLLKNGVKELINALKDKNLSDDFILSSFRILANCGKISINGLNELLKNDDRTSIRSLSLVALLSSGDYETIQSLKYFENDTDNEVRDIVLQLITLIENPCLESFVSLLKQGNDTYKIIASIALGNINDNSTIEYLKNIIRSESNEDIVFDATFSLSKMITSNQSVKQLFINELHARNMLAMTFLAGVFLIKNGVNILNEV